jgi:adenosylcobinamide kinase / adenosylcobinamide-phosphate guanylyltransferase
MSLVLVLGGQKSGKSSYAATLARRRGAPVTVLAPARADDPELAERIDHHRRDRPPEWATLERFDLGPALEQLDPSETVIVDALDTWLVEAMHEAGLFTDDDVAPLGPEATAASEALLDEFGRVTDAAATRPGLTVLVAGQPGLGPHPLGASARRYVDLHGLALQRASARAADVRFLVAGRALPVPPH